MGEFGEKLEADWISVSRALPAVFTTQDFVSVLRSTAPATWNALAERYGPGGKGTGNYYSPANVVFNFLKRKSADDVIFRRQFVPSEPGWGSHLVAQWEQISPDSGIPPEEGELEVIEGNPLLRAHFVRERNIGLRPRMLRNREKDGLSCDCCGRAEPKLDIEMQRSIFEVHHRRPLSAGQSKTKLSDLDLLCATCHRLIHKAIRLRQTNVTADDLRRILGLRSGDKGMRK